MVENWSNNQYRLVCMAKNIIEGTALHIHVQRLHSNTISGLTFFILSYIFFTIFLQKSATNWRYSLFKISATRKRAMRIKLRDKVFRVWTDSDLVYEPNNQILLVWRKNRPFPEPMLILECGQFLFHIEAVRPFLLWSVVACCWWTWWRVEIF